MVPHCHLVIQIETNLLTSRNVQIAVYAFNGSLTLLPNLKIKHIEIKSVK